MFPVPVQGDFFLQPQDSSVHPNAKEPLPSCFLEDVPVFTFLSPDKRCKDFNAFPGKIAKNHGEDFIDRVAVDPFPAKRAVRSPDPAEKQSQVIIDFGDGADGRPRVVRNSFLLDRNGRGQAGDVVDVGFV